MKETQRGKESLHPESGRSLLPTTFRKFRKFVVNVAYIGIIFILFKDILNKNVKIAKNHA